MSKTIGIDISAVIYGTGVSVYTDLLVRNILKIDTLNTYLLFGGSLRRKNELKEWLNSLQPASYKGITYPIPPSLADIIWNKLHILPIEKMVGNMDVFLSSDWTQPPSSAFKVTTVHDLSPLRFPELTPKKVLKAHKMRLKWVIKDVDRIIVPSNMIMGDLVSLGVDQKKVRVIYEAPEPIYFPAHSSEVQRIRNKYRISSDYLLCIGINKRKNTTRIIQAYERVRTGIKAKLVIVGNNLQNINTPRGVYLLGHVDKKDLPGLYSSALALVYPSLYEGFGLPILEAFACGTPVVTSNSGSTAEVAGKGAVLVNPESVTDIADGIILALKKRASLVQKGYIRVKKFSWEAAARQTINVFDEAG